MAPSSSSTASMAHFNTGVWSVGTHNISACKRRALGEWPEADMNPHQKRASGVRMPPLTTSCTALQHSSSGSLRSSEKLTHPRCWCPLERPEKDDVIHPPKVAEQGLDFLLRR
jgi:hypothetical protein